MIEVYRSGNKGGESFDRYSEICRDCAKSEIEEGHYVEIDSYASSEIVGQEDFCQRCEGDFFVDGRRRENKHPLEMA